MTRVLLVDDERPARQKLRTLLSREPGIEIVGEACDGEEAVREIQRHSPDVVFLDVSMPRLDGFGVIEALEGAKVPLVVFVTAHDEHALRAFEVHAVDYLLKPFTAKRLRNVLGRVDERMRTRQGHELATRLQEALAEIEARRGGLRRVRVEAQPNREILLSLDTVDVIRARGNYVEFHATAGCFLRRGTLGELEEKLDPEQFVRINRSEIVRLDAVKEMQPWFHGDYHVILKGGATLVWTRRFRQRRDAL